MKNYILVIISSILLLTVSNSQLRISPTPTLAEIKTAFTRLHTSDNDVFTSLSTIIQRKDEAVPALRDYINAFSLKDEDTGEEPDRLYGVLALEGIGTQEAFNALFQTALLHPETETKGKSLQIFASSYYGKVLNDSIVPDKEIIHLFLRNCDDTSYVVFCHKRIGEIARDGMKTWTGIDYGDLTLEKTKIQVGKLKTEMSMEQYREWWWEKYQTRLIWNSKSTTFEIQN